MAEAEAKDSVEQLCKAMKGWGTDDSKLIAHMTAKRSNKDMVALVKAYAEVNGRDLVKDIKGDTSGNYEKLLVALAMDQAVYDAHLVRASVKGIGTNDDKLNEVLCTRTGDELKAMCAAYENEYKRDALKDIQDDTSGDTKKLFTLLLTSERPTASEAQLSIHVSELYDAGTGKWGTNEDKFISILGGHSKAYIAQLNKAYENHHGHDLGWVVKDEFSGSIAKALKVLVTPVDEYYCNQLKKAMVGLGTDDSLLQRVMVSQRHYKGRLALIAKTWETGGKAKKEHTKKEDKEHDEATKDKKEKKNSAADIPLRQWIKDETSGDYGATLLSIFDNFTYAPAKKLA